MSLRMDRVETMAETGPTMRNFLSDVLVNAERIQDIANKKANKKQGETLTSEG